MRKKRVLFVGEASWNTSGYSVYAKELLTRLCKEDSIEVAELACYASKDDVECDMMPWKVYGNAPPEGSEEWSMYKGRQSNTYGEWSFGVACADFKPDIVIDIRDYWMIEHELRNPFFNYFHWAIMPAVDASPQNSSWVNTYRQADSLFAYCEFGRDVLLTQGKDIDYVGLTPPAASLDYKPLQYKADNRDELGLNTDCNIVGTVMRNQTRKLYPDLFESFAKYIEGNLERTKNTFLYCHTSFPDIGWDIPALLSRYSLHNRVLFSYQCVSCKDLSVDFLKTGASFCDKCYSYNKHMVSGNNKIDEKQLNKVYNTFDVYVQWANQEGFGMPQVEAAYAGCPIITVGYSAMDSVAKNLECMSVKPIGYSMECSTGRLRAIPDNKKLTEKLECIFKLSGEDRHNLGLSSRQKALHIYNWDKTAKTWIDRIKEIEFRDLSETWYSEPDIKSPSSEIPYHLQDPVDQVDFLFKNVLHKPDWIGGPLWSKVLRDLSYGFAPSGIDEDVYWSDSNSSNAKNKSFDLEEAHSQLSQLRGQFNQMEQLRIAVNNGTEIW
jgi:glycosyltransferase involved in cell wall biosynthesis